jgi:phospholipid/cholesterol/gamma-HCH transport system ATP-binding protein
VIVVKDLHMVFGEHHVLKGISLHVKKSRIRVILGLSGSGKSVLIKNMIGLLKPTSGSVCVDGVDIAGLDGAGLLGVRKKCGMVFQQAALFDSMHVFDNVAFPLREHTRLSPAEVSEKVLERLHAVGLEGAEYKFPSELSGGMRKRVGLARAVVLDPQCVLYDEPTTGLDPITTRSVDDMIVHASERWNVTSVVISHDIGSALRIADDIAVLNEGVIVEDCEASALTSSQNPFVRQFLSAWFEKNVP